MELVGEYGMVTKWRSCLQRWRNGGVTPQKWRSGGVDDSGDGGGPGDEVMRGVWAMVAAAEWNSCLWR